MYYVFSTLTNDQAYTNWNHGGNDVAKRGKTVLIKGGANRADKNFLTPKGVVTKVTDEELEFLKGIRVFKIHVEKGFIKYEKAQKNVDKVSEDMSSKDASAPLKDGDFDAGKAPTTNAPKK